MITIYASFYVTKFWISAFHINIKALSLESLQLGIDFAEVKSWVQCHFQLLTFTLFMWFIWCHFEIFPLLIFFYFKEIPPKVFIFGKMA